jgi:hypothetical protein
MKYLYSIGAAVHAVHAVLTSEQYAPTAHLQDTAAQPVLNSAVELYKSRLRALLHPDGVTVWAT